MNRNERYQVDHDGFTVHPDVTPALERTLRTIVEELQICEREHPEDERLARMVASVRWLIGERR